jgi:hypothetical protein
VRHERCSVGLRHALLALKVGLCGLYQLPAPVYFLPPVAGPLGRQSGEARNEVLIPPAVAPMEAENQAQRGQGPLSAHDFLPFCIIRATGECSSWARSARLVAVALVYLANMLQLDQPASVFRSVGSPPDSKKPIPNVRLKA